MTSTMRLICSLPILLVAESLVAQPAYPQKPIRVIVGFPPGGPADIVARLVGRKFTESWSKPVVTENISGAAGNIATDRLAKATPDGYTLGLSTEAQIVINPGLYELPYDPAKDFVPVSEVTVAPNILVVHNTLAAKSIRELVALAKSQPAQLTFASSGSGSGNHMAAEMFKSVAAIDIRHIPYKGVATAVPDLISGRVTMMFSPIPLALPLVREGKLRALAVSSLHRSSAAAELPTISESGYPGFDVTGWIGLLAPAGTPSTIVQKLNRETVAALAQPEVRARLADLGLEAVGSSPGEFANVIRAGILRWAKIIKEAHIKPD